MKEKPVIALFKLEVNKITLKIFLKNTKEIIFQEFEYIKNTFKASDINSNSQVIKNLLTNANRSLSLMINDVYVIYPDSNVSISNLKIKKTQFTISSTTGERSEIEDLIETRIRDKHIFNDLFFLKFKTFSIYNSSNNIYKVKGNSYYENIDFIKLIKNLFNLTNIRIIDIVPTSFMVPDMVSSTDFIEISINLSRVKINHYKNNILNKQIVLKNELKSLIENLSHSYQVNKYHIYQNIISQINLEEKNNKTVLIKAKLNEFQLEEQPELLNEDLNAMVKEYLEITFENITSILSKNNLLEKNKIITGNIFQIDSTNSFIKHHLTFDKFMILDQYKEKKISIFFENVYAKYIINNNRVKINDNIILSIKERAISLTNNHKMIVPLKMFMKNFNKKFFDLSKY